MNTLTVNNTQPHTGRSLFRFETNTNNSQQSTNNSNNNSMNRTNIKRSVSQVPSTDRRPLAGSSSANTSSTSSFLTSPSNNTSLQSAPDNKIFDYQVCS